MEDDPPSHHNLAPITLGKAGHAQNSKRGYEHGVLHPHGHGAVTQEGAISHDLEGLPVHQDAVGHLPHLSGDGVETGILVPFVHQTPQIPIRHLLEVCEVHGRFPFVARSWSLATAIVAA